MTGARPTPRAQPLGISDPAGTPTERAGTPKEEILSGIRRSLRRGPVDPETAAQLRARVASHRRNLIPARAAALGHRAQVDLFVAMAEEVQATVARVASPAEVPDAVARYLSGENLPAELVMAPDPGLDAIPWAERPLLRIRRGRAEAEDAASLTPAFAAIAETGTLLLISGRATPTTLNFLPDTHIVVLREEQVVATYEDAWDRLCAHAEAQGGLPRTANFITGPSRTADIEQRLELGAHGPRRLHIVLVAGEAKTEDGGNPENG
ncbi:MAG TPA: lactate utilization protein [Stellaceae bacterium]|nr:lactate utilization protein [Stellaceae bacterium]